MSEPKNRKRPRNKLQSEVGYGHPPVDQQFGNPKRTGRVNTDGRPKKKKQSPTLDDELNKKLVITQGGKRKSSTVREAIYKRLIQRALEGEFRAMKLALEHDARAKEQDDDVDPFGIDPKLMEEILQKHEDEVAARARRARRRKPHEEREDD